MFLYFNASILKAVRLIESRCAHRGVPRVGRASRRALRSVDSRARNPRGTSPGA